MKAQKLLLVDNNDKFLGYSSIKECHTGRGKRHRAFVTLLFDSQNRNRVLLQRRKHRLFDGLWDLTAISHPLRINGRSESYQEASDRALKKEMGIGHVPIKKIGGFTYFAQDGENCENEYCAVLVGQYDGNIKPNSNEVYETKWIRYSHFIQGVRKNSSAYTPWSKETVNIFVNPPAGEAGREPLMVNRNDPNDFKDELNRFLREFNKYSRAFFSKKQTLVKKYPALIPRFYKEIEDFSAGGKAMRPFLVYLGYKIAKFQIDNDVKKIMPICLAIELVHNFLLIHDDIIDKSDRRRGKPTVHKRFEKGRDAHYAISQAIVAGDIALIEALGLINESKFDEGLKTQCEDMLVKVILETAYGEVMDIEYAKSRPKISEIWQVCELKTARYSFVGPPTIGAILGGINKNVLKSIEDFGLLCGKAFQLKDDILGVFGDENVLGKSTLSDMREGKNTILFYKTREMVGVLQRRLLERVWGNPKSNIADLKRIRVIMEKSGAKKWCDGEMAKLIKRAKASVNKITKDNKIRNILFACADFVIYRES